MATVTNILLDCSNVEVEIKTAALRNSHYEEASPVISLRRL
jgi:hypothetical protein